MFFKDFLAPIVLLLFSVAILLFTCLCVLCKRKNRKTSDVHGSSQHIEDASTSWLPRSISRFCGADSDEECAERETEHSSRSRAPSSMRTGHSNQVFSTDSESNSTLPPPAYEEAIKTQYQKIYPEITTADEAEPNCRMQRRAQSISDPGYPLTLDPNAMPTLEPCSSSVMDSEVQVVTSFARTFTVPSSHDGRQELETPPPPYNIAVIQVK